jgi:hypothetical protein
VLRRKSFIVKSILSPRPLAALAVFAAAFAPAPAQALGSAFSCSAVTYQVVGAQLKIGSVDSNVLSYTNVGSAYSSSYNAGGYNTVDNFIYALAGSPANLLKIASDGTVESNAVTGVTTPHNFVAGDVSTDGQSLIAFNYNDSLVWSIDLDTFIGTEIGSLTTAMPPANVGDFAIVTDGAETTAYGFDTTTGNLISFDPTGHFDAASTNVSVAIGPGSAKGAVWADSSGNLTVFVNTTGDVYSVKNPGAVTPVVKKVASLGASTTGNDGMKCALAASAFPEPDAGGADPELAATGVSTSEITLFALSGFALLAAGNAVRRSRRRFSPRA